MDNRFFEMDQYLAQQCRDKKAQQGNGRSSVVDGNRYDYAVSQSFGWSGALSVQNRVLVVLLENGGVDLGIPELVDKILSGLHIAVAVPDFIRRKIVDYLRDELRSVTDNLLETAELTINRYSAAKPALFGDVIVLRNGTATYQQLKDTLMRLSKEQKVIDLFILTHGRENYIALSGNGGVNDQSIAEIRKANGGPLTIRSVYMMNCNGSTLNKAWLDAGAKVSSGAVDTNYLPEPSMYFFWNSWKAGEDFERAATGAFRKTVNLMNVAVRTVLGNIPLLSSYASSVNFENFDFVKKSTPAISGLRTLTISSDELNFAQSQFSTLTTTVFSLSALQSLAEAGSLAGNKAERPWKISKEGVDFIKKFEGFRSKMYNDPAGHCTIGYGTLIHQGNCNGADSEAPYSDGFSEEKATLLLQDEIRKLEQTLNESTTVDLTQNQVDALLSFTYNVGPGAFKDSTLLKVLNQGKYEEAPAEIKKWTKVKIDGKLGDLPGLVTRRNAEASLFTTSSIATAQSVLDNFSRPFYDTGEHALLGEFIDKAHSGPLAGVVPLQPTTTYTINTVPFTYGQIITMGDFYDSFDDLRKAPAAELNRLKPLIVRSENHYRNLVLRLGGAVPPDVKNEEWGDKNTGIGQRYIDMALRNNSHFAPPPPGVSSTQKNNRKEWETYHERAIQGARAGTPLDQVYPINAFGDHFLTDAFSAGHLINKELVMNKFISNVISGKSLNSTGEKLFEQVADRALANPDIKKELSKWEVMKTSVLILGKHLNLDTTWPKKAFYEVLKGILEDTSHGGREQIANLSVKAVHDYLNKYVQPKDVKGVPVKNNKGMSWNLAGDGTLSWDDKRPNNFEIVQLAVKQSVENIQDAVVNKSTPVATYFQRVWDYVPLLNDPTTKAIVDNAVSIYTNPASPQLVAKAVDLIHDELTILIQALLDAKEIRRVGTTVWG